MLQWPQYIESYYNTDPTNIRMKSRDSDGKLPDLFGCSVVQWGTRSDELEINIIFVLRLKNMSCHVMENTMFNKVTQISRIVTWHCDDTVSVPSTTTTKMLIFVTFLLLHQHQVNLRSISCTDRINVHKASFQYNLTTFYQCRSYLCSYL